MVAPKLDVLQSLSTLLFHAANVVGNGSSVGIFGDWLEFKSSRGMSNAELCSKKWQYICNGSR